MATIWGAQESPVRLKHGLARTKKTPTSVPTAPQRTPDSPPFHILWVGELRWGTRTKQSAGSGCGTKDRASGSAPTTVSYPAGRELRWGTRTKQSAGSGCGTKDRASGSAPTTVSYPVGRELRWGTNKKLAGGMAPAHRWCHCERSEAISTSQN